MISAAEREAYERDGVVCLRGGFPRQWLDFLADAIEEAMAIPTADPGLAHGARLDSERFPLAWEA